MDNNLQDMIAKAVVDIIKQKEDNKGIKVGVSARHVHLSQEHLEILFGKGHELTVKKMLMGDQFAAEECVTLSVTSYNRGCSCTWSCQKTITS